MEQSLGYYYHLLVLVGIYLILAQSFNVSFGLGKLLNLSHIAIYAIGAYTTALLSTEQGYGFWVCIFSSMVVCAFSALIIGAISLKLSEDYFAIGTLAFSAVVSALLVNWKSLTRGVLGIPNIPRPAAFGRNFEDLESFVVLIILVNVVVLTFLYFVFQSRLSRDLKAQGEHEQATLGLGKNTKAIRRDSFILSSFFAGLAGSLFAYYMNYIDPTSFQLHEMVFVLSIVVVGQPGSFWGVIAATFFLVLLPEPLRFIDMPSSILGPMRELLRALILFGVVYWKRETLFPVQREV